MKNVSHYAQTNRFQFRMTLFGQFFGEVGFTTAEDAGFVADLCKRCLMDGFQLTLHRSIDYSLCPDVFRSRCQAAGLNPDQPISFAESELVPASFRTFVRDNRAEWENSLRLRARHNLKGAEDYARYSENPEMKQWGLMRDALQSRVAKFKALPLAWWRNLFLGCNGGVETAANIVSRQLSPSLHTKFNSREHPEIFPALHAAYENLLKAQASVQHLEETISEEERKITEALDAHIKLKPADNYITS